MTVYWYLQNQVVYFPFLNIFVVLFCGVSSCLSVFPVIIFHVFQIPSPSLAFWGSPIQTSYSIIG